DSAAYLMNHKKRNIQKPNITPEKARESVKIDFDIDSTRLAMIPKGSKEILCYEFKGKYKGSDFIIYINALNGKEEDILQIIKSENGTLTF
ncbi:germination protein YpeB, partial [Clostridium cochlearium]|nr:germination protein YpeB [Clostridium cochlearium]